MIYFASENVWIRVNSKKEWNFHDWLNNSSSSQKLLSSWMTQRKVSMTINETELWYYINSRTDDITETYNYNKSVFLQLTVWKSDMKLINNLDKHISLDYIWFDSQFEKAED
jgi:hypothetical protein